MPAALHQQLPVAGIHDGRRIRVGGMVLEAEEPLAPHHLDADEFGIRPPFCPEKHPSLLEHCAAGGFATAASSCSRACSSHRIRGAEARRYAEFLAVARSPGEDVLEDHELRHKR